jgi:hypothetical protein
MRFANYLFAALFVLALGLPSMRAADASPVNYTFLVTATEGPLAGTTAPGAFSYDTSSIVPGGINNNIGLLTALNFTWNGITYNQTTANTGFLGFDAAGMLTSDTFGTDCIPGNPSACHVSSPGPEAWFVAIPFIPVPPEFVYHVQGVDGNFLGTVTQNLVAAAPEPPALALLGVAVAGLTLVGVRRRQRLA